MMKYYENIHTKYIGSLRTWTPRPDQADKRFLSEIFSKNFSEFISPLSNNIADKCYLLLLNWEKNNYKKVLTKRVYEIDHEILWRKTHLLKLTKCVKRNWLIKLVEKSVYKYPNAPTHWLLSIDISLKSQIFSK